MYKAQNSISTPQQNKNEQTKTHNYNKTADHQTEQKSLKESKSIKY
jgi:hypothetical protein